MYHAPYGAVQDLHPNGLPSAQVPGLVEKGIILFSPSTSMLQP